MKPSIFEIQGPYPGKLFIMPKPSGEWLQEDIHHYQSLGVSTVISLLEPAEVVELSLSQEAAICAAKNIEFHNFPIPDRGLPNPSTFAQKVSLVRDRLKKEMGVAVHCRAGIGRSGMLVCCALTEFIEPVDRVIDLVTEARGVRVPDTEDQHEFILSFAL